MQISPIKRPLKPPRVEGYQYGLLSDRNNTIGNSLQLIETEDRPFAHLSILGETSATPTDPEQEVSPDNPQTLTSLTSFDYIAENADASETITKSISLKDTSDNQLEARGIPLTYNADGSVATWAAQDKVGKGSDSIWYLEGQLTEGLLGVPKAMVTTYPNVDYAIISKPTNITGYNSTYTCGKLLCSHGIQTEANFGVSTDVGKLNVTPSKTNFWFGFPKGTVLADAITALSGAKIIYQLATPTTTELCAADQTALNEAETAGTFAGITNISLSTPIGKIKVEQWSKSAMR